MRPWKTGFVMAGAIAVAVTGCSSSSKGSASKPGSNGTATTVGTIPTVVPNNLDKRGAVALTGCAAARNGWEASGTATNPDKGATKYMITVFFTTNQATVEGDGTTTIDVAAGKAAHWKIDARFSADPSTTCVLRGVG